MKVVIKHKKRPRSYLGLSLTIEVQQPLCPLVQTQPPPDPDVDAWLCTAFGACGAATEDVVAQRIAIPAATASTTMAMAVRARSTALGESWAVRS
jgi:hypothetical protein